MGSWGHFLSFPEALLPGTWKSMKKWVQTCSDRTKTKPSMTSTERMPGMVIVSI
jgi:hypothetical protein